MDARRRLVQLFKDGKVLMYRREDVIIRPGDTPSGVYYIVSGCIKVYSLCKNGEPNILLTLGSNQIFPLAWALSGNLRDVGFTALAPTEVWRISQSSFSRAMLTDPLAVSGASHMLAQQFSALVCEMDNLQYRSAREKVAFRLIYLAKHFGERDGNTIVIRNHIPNEYIARSTNMTRETASREVNRLIRKGLIQTTGGQIAILDLPRLKNEISRHFNLATLSLD